MKKVLFLLMFLSALNTYSQDTTYIAFPTNYGFWAYYYLDDFYQPTEQHIDYTLSGDTTLNNKTYKKIFTFDLYEGAVRDTNQTIYYVPADSSQEYVLYDFNLAVGDTFIWPFQFYQGFESDTLIVVSEDSTLATDGYHRSLNLQYNNSFNATWIEGIGSMYDLLTPTSRPPGVSGFNRLYCMSSDTNFIYPNISHCVSAVNEQKDPNSLLVYPNPSGGMVNIDFGNKNTIKLVITGLAGNVVNEINTVNQSKVIIDNLQPGLYILTVYDRKGMQGFKKLVIQ